MLAEEAVSCSVAPFTLEGHALNTPLTRGEDEDT